jgi:hypothetical protein
MKTDRIKYTKYFKETDEWIGMEVVVEDGDDVKVAFMGAKIGVDDAFKAFHPIGVTPSEIQVRDKNRDQPTGDLVRDITTCKDLKTLESYKFIVSMKGNEKAAEAYEMMLKRLSPDENKL